MTTFGGRAWSAALCVLVAIMGCGRWAGEPRYGSLKRDDRTFEFSHNIELFELSNGMKVALIRDTRTNFATVDVRYAVGAAEDPVGRAGMAHLVEHLLFFSRPAPDQPTAWDQLREITLSFNAVTTSDTTTFTSRVPIAKLHEVIALESGRMGTPCARIDPATFARERDVVLAETAQSAADVELTFRLYAVVFGANHPYARPVATNQIATATLDETCRFVDQYYGPNRAYLVVTGPFDGDELRQVIGHSFGPIAHQATGQRTPVPAPILTGQVDRLAGPVPYPTALVFLPHPAWGAPGAVTYQVARDRLARALLDADDKYAWIRATNVSLIGGARARALAVQVEVTSPGKLQPAVDEVFLRAAHMFDDLDRAGARELASQMTAEYLETWDDSAARGGWIADFLEYTDHNWFMLKELRTIATLDWKATILSLAVNLSEDQSHVVLMTPQEHGHGRGVTAIAAGSHDVEPWRAPVDPAEAMAPLAFADPGGLGERVETYQLPNGLTVELAVDHRSPIVDARLVFAVGSAHEPADKPYLATAAARLLYYAATKELGWAAIEKLNWALGRGTETTAEVGETSTTFHARGLAQWGDWHVWYLSMLLDQGGYGTRLMTQLHESARRSALEPDAEVDPDALAFWSSLYGEGHPYTKLAPTRSMAFLAIEASDLTAWKRDHYQVRGATLIVSGNYDLAQMKREIEELFGPLSNAAPAARPTVPAARPVDGPTWLADDERGMIQVSAKVGFATGSDPVRDRAARDVLLRMIVDGLRDVRERLAASYGVNVSYLEGEAGGALYVSGLLDEGKAGVAMQAILATLRGLRDDSAAHHEAFVRARRAALSDALAQTGGASSLADQLEASAVAGLGYDSNDELAAQIAALTPAAVAAVGAKDLTERHMVVQLEGRTAVIDAAFAAIGVTPGRVSGPEADEPEVDEPEPERPVITAPRPTPSPTSRARLDLPALPPGTAADRLSVGSQDDRVGPRHSGYFQGDRPISMEELLRISGHGDRANAVNNRWWLRHGLMIGGVAVAATGTVVRLTRDDCSQLDEDRMRSQWQHCQAVRDQRGWLSVAIISTGLVAVLTGTQLSKLAPTELELRKYAQSYNRRRHLHDASEDAVTDVRIEPVIAPGGGGLVLSGRF